MFPGHFLAIYYPAITQAANVSKINSDRSIPSIQMVLETQDH